MSIIGGDDGRSSRNEKGTDEKGDVPAGTDDVSGSDGRSEEWDRGPDGDEADHLSWRFPDPIDVEVKRALEDDDGDGNADDGRERVAGGCRSYHAENLGSEYDARTDEENHARNLIPV